jgi:hypothetical protein
VPTTLVGLIIFVCLITPGICYNFRREGDRPITKPASAIRETARLVILGFAADAIALAAFTLFHLWQPSHTPHPGRFVRLSGDYFRSEYSYLLVWGTGLLVLACLIAVLLAAVRTTRAVDQFLSRGPTGWLFKQSVATQPAWWLMFNLYPNASVYVGCALANGSYMAGSLYSFSPESDETPDRELTLSAPITFRPADSDDAVTLDVSAAIISAREITFLTVTYITPVSSSKVPAEGVADLDQSSTSSQEQ